MSYYVTSTETTITFHVTAVEGADRYRLFWRPSDTTTAESYTIDTTSSFAYTATGLTPATEYTVNVIYFNTSVSESEYTAMGAKTIETDYNIVYRPSDWSWTSNIASEQPISITATEWNNFRSRINEFRDYLGLSQWSFTDVSKGDDITAATCNGAIRALAAIASATGIDTLPNLVSKGDEIYASFFIDLQNFLNAVP